MVFRNLNVAGAPARPFEAWRRSLLHFDSMRHPACTWKRPPFQEAFSILMPPLAGEPGDDALNSPTFRALSGPFGPPAGLLGLQASRPSKSKGGLGGLSPR